MTNWWEKDSVAVAENTPAASTKNWWDKDSDLVEEPMSGGGGRFRGHGAQGSFAPETLGEKIKSIGVMDILAHLPFSPLHDYEKKGAAEAESKLRKGKGYGPNRVYTMGGVGFPSYQAPREPQTVDTLTKITEDYAEKQARGETIPA